MPPDPVKIPDGPVVLVKWSQDARTWTYQWWDTGYGYVTAQSPTRRKDFFALEGVLAALLADRARTFDGKSPVDSLEPEGFDPRADA